MAITELNDRIELASFLPDVTAITQSSTANDITNFLAKNTSSTFTISDDYLSSPILSDTTNNKIFVEAINQQTNQRYIVNKGDSSTNYGSDWIEGYYKVHVRQYKKPTNSSNVVNAIQNGEFYELTKKPLYWNRSMLSFMTYIQPGTFWMGSPTNEIGRTASRETLHQVTISKGFYIERVPLTTAFAYALLNCNGCTPLNYYTSGTTSNGVTTYTQYSESLTILSKSTEYSSCFARGTATDDYLNYKFAYYTSNNNYPIQYMSYSKYNRSPYRGILNDYRTYGFGASGSDANHKGFYVLSGIAYPIAYFSGENLDENEDRSFLHACNLKIKISGYKWDAPTDAQWEYACRAGTTSAFSNGENLKFNDTTTPQSNINEICWYKLHDSKIHYVAQLKPNKFGLFDMHGNIYNSCKDWLTDNITSHTNGDEPMSGTLIANSDSKVYRGGAYTSDSLYTRAACRYPVVPIYSSNNRGHRLVLIQE